jgi:hypothetical protein
MPYLLAVIACRPLILNQSACSFGLRHGDDAVRLWRRWFQRPLSVHAAVIFPGFKSHFVIVWKNREGVNRNIVGVPIRVAHCYKFAHDEVEILALFFWSQIIFEASNSVVVYVC